MSQLRVTALHWSSIIFAIEIDLRLARVLGSLHWQFDPLKLNSVFIPTSQQQSLFLFDTASLFDDLHRQTISSPNASRL